MDVYDLQEYHIPKNNTEKFFFMWTKRTKLVLAVISRSVDHPGGEGWTNLLPPEGSNFSRLT